MCIRDSAWVLSGYALVGVHSKAHTTRVAGKPTAGWDWVTLSLIHISEPTRLLSISYAVFCLKKKSRTTTT